VGISPLPVLRIPALALPSRCTRENFKGLR